MSGTLSRKPLIAANWKLNGNLALCQQFAAGIVEQLTAEVVICPPAAYFLAEDFVSVGAKARFKMGAQHISTEVTGAFTGEISATMLRDTGVDYVIIGHSERRALYNESDADVLKKALLAFEHQLTPIICVGESLAQREDEQTFTWIKQQLDAMLTHFSDEQLAKMVIAYEPLWAVGTGKVALPEQAQAVHAWIRQLIAEKSSAAAECTRILYGGSVKASNARGLLCLDDVDGALVGGASLHLDEFNQIILSA